MLCCTIPTCAAYRNTIFQLNFTAVRYVNDSQYAFSFTENYFDREISDAVDSLQNTVDHKLQISIIDIITMNVIAFGPLML